ncbi:MAG: GNAT family N-acetyltransferase [Bacteroidia bacterium]|nr:GNAT family N-acetyltransferase [Bacteroidia bacterium]
MKIVIETPRLILREILPEDDKGIFELDSDPEVHTYLGKRPITSVQQAKDAIAFIRKQYVENGIGRWAVIEKESGAFVGWSGLKLMKELTNNHINYYDLGYRFIKKHWGKGYATETARATVDYAFNKMALSGIYGMAEAGNARSRHVLEKVGLRHEGQFMYDGVLHDWFKISKM